MQVILDLINRKVLQKSSFLFESVIIFILTMIIIVISSNSIVANTNMKAFLKIIKV